MRSTIGACVLALLALGAAGCKSEPDKPKPPPVDEAADQEPAPAPTPPPPPPIDAAPAAPEPTTPEEIDAARKQAMIDGREKDVIKYCEMAKVEPKKTDPQVLLGCALAACRLGDMDKAKVWAEHLPKPLKDQAIKICSANSVKL
jgi:predicted outer membrane protein